MKQEIKPKPPKENVIQAHIKQYLTMKGWLVIQNATYQQLVTAHKGLSDLICVREGLVLFLEVKRPGGKLSPHQEKFKEEIEAHGGNYMVAFGIDDLLEAGL